MRLDHSSWQVAATVAALLVIPGTTAIGQSGAPVANASDARAWEPPRTSWGDPDLTGNFTNKDETAPFERPEELGTREFLTDEEFARRDRRAQEQHAQRQNPIPDPESTSINPGGEWLEFRGASRRTSLIVDPPDGRLPPQTYAAKQRAAARERERSRRGPADSYEDRSLYDRCISRGLPGSMMPVIYGNSYRIVQAPGVVAISYEMIHETRLKRPFTFAMDLTRDDREAMIEYACHEGNMAMANILSGHRADERAAAAAAAAAGR